MPRYYDKDIMGTQQAIVAGFGTCNHLSLPELESHYRILYSYEISAWKYHLYFIFSSLCTPRRQGLLWVIMTSVSVGCRHFFRAGTNLFNLWSLKHTLCVQQHGLAKTYMGFRERIVCCYSVFRFFFLRFPIFWVKAFSLFKA